MEGKKNDSMVGKKNAEGAITYNPGRVAELVEDLGLLTIKTQFHAGFFETTPIAIRTVPAGDHDRYICDYLVEKEHLGFFSLGFEGESAWHELENRICAAVKKEVMNEQLSRGELVYYVDSRPIHDERGEQITVRGKYVTLKAPPRVVKEYRVR